MSEARARAGRLPYTGTPDVQPRFAPPEFQRIEATPREFGAQVGEAEEKVGGELTKTSDLYGQIAADEQVNHVLTGLDTISQQMLALRGKDAMDQGPGLRQQGAQLLAQARGNLGLAGEQIDFDRQTRYLYARFDREMGSHLDEQQKIWGAGVNDHSADLALNGIAKATQSGDQNAIGTFTHDLISARIKKAQLIYGTDLDPAIQQDIIRSSNADATKGQVEALLLTDPVKAQALIRQNSQYFNPLELRALTDTTDRFAEKANDAAIIRSITHAGITGSEGGGENNPGNIRVPGSTGTGAQAFQSFPTREAGIAAIGSTLDAYQDQHGINTLAGFIGRYSPSTENDTAALVRSASARTGIAPNQTIDIHDPATKTKMVDAILAQEQGGSGRATTIPTGVASASPMQQPVPNFPTFDQWVDKIPDGLSDASHDRIYAGLRKQYNHMLQASSAARSQVLAQYKGGLQMLQDGRDYEYDEGQIRRLFPKDTADEMIGNLKDATTIGHQVQAVRGMPLSEALTQQAANRSVLASASPQNYDRQRKLSDAFDKALTAHIKGLAEDPAGYVASTNPEIERARQMMMQPPAAPPPPGQLSLSESYAAKMLGEEDRLQVPEDDRHVLDNIYARGLATQIASDPEQAPGRLKEMEQQWGAAWPAVWHDLTTTGKLPPAYQMVGSLENPADGALMARGLAEANKEGVNKSLESLIDKGAVGTTRPAQAIRSNIEGNEDIASYEHSMAMSGASPDQVKGIVSSITLLAQAKMLWGGATNPAQAAKDAVTSAIGKWEFMPNGGARVPRANFDNVSAAADAVVGSLTLAQVQHPAMYDTKQAPGSATADDWLRTLQASPNWTTVGDKIRLMDNGGRFVRRAGGGFVEVPFGTAAPVSAAAVPDYTPQP